MRYFVYLLASLLLGGSGRAFAQSAPVWQGVIATPDIMGAGVVDAAGNWISESVFQGTVTVGTTTLTSTTGNAFLTKYAPNGQVLWVRQLTSSGSNIIEDIAVDATGNVYVTGLCYGSIALGNNLTLPNPDALPLAFVVRYSAQGTPEWFQYSSPLYRSLGVETDAAGHVFLLGDYGTTMQLGGLSISSGGPLYPATFLARLSAATGAVEWLQNAFTRPNASWLSSGSRLVVGPGGAPVVLHPFGSLAPLVPGGPTLTASGPQDIAIIRYTPQGTFDWVQQVRCPQQVATVTRGTIDATGNLYVTGGMAGPASFGSTTLPHTGGVDAFLAKYSPTGTPLWAQRGGGAGLDTWINVTLDAAGNAYLAGCFEASAQYGSTALTSAGGIDALFASYSPQGQLRWTQQAGGATRDNATYLGVDAAGLLYARGTVSPPATFGPFTLPGTTTPTYFLARLTDATLTTRPTRAAQPLSLYPNPAHDQLHLPALPAGTPVQLLDALGRVVRETPVTAGAVPVRGLPAGLYQLRALDAQGRPRTGRVLVE